MPVEWRDEGFQSRANITAPTGLLLDKCAGSDQWKAWVIGSGYVGTFPTRDAAKLAAEAEAEARRVLMQGLREFGGAEASWRALVDKALGYLHNDNCHDAIPLLVEALDNG